MFVFFGRTGGCVVKGFKEPGFCGTSWHQFLFYTGRWVLERSDVVRGWPVRFRKPLFKLCPTAKRFIEMVVCVLLSPGC